MVTNYNLIKSGNVKEFLSTCEKLKPSDLIIDDLKWKYLVRSVVKGKNILILGSTGGGKTKSAHSVAVALGNEDNFYRYNCGSSQDARSFLIGNTFYDKDKGTFFCESTFVKSIQKENVNNNLSMKNYYFIR